MNTGGQAATSHLVPTLLPPHKKTTSSRLPAIAAWFFDFATPGVSQAARALPMKFV